MKSSFLLTALLTSLMTGLTPALSLAQGNWETLPPMPTARTYTAGAVVDGKFYVFGGMMDINTPTDVVEMYNLTAGAEGSWVTKHKMPQAMIGMAAVADTLNGKIYLIGGAPSYFSSASNKVYEYDPLLDTFIAKTPLPEPRAFMAACEWNGDIYAIGGTTQAGAGEVFQTVLKYNPSSPLGWVSVNSLIKKRNVAAAVVLDDKIFVTGGDEEGLLNGSKTTEVLDLTAPGSAWMLLGADMMGNRWMHGAGVIDGQLYVFGGASNGEELSNVEMLNMSNGEWVAGPDMLAQHRMFAYASYDDAIYAAGGQGGGVVQNKFEKFSVVSSSNDRQSGRVGLLYQNYPNPFVGSTTIEYQVTTPGDVEITLHDVAGKMVKTAVRSHHFPGTHSVNLQAGDLESGVYFYTTKNGEGNSITRKMVVLK